MRRISLTILLIAIGAGSLFSQSFNNNDNVANLGIGVGGINMNMGINASASLEHGTIPIKKVGVISFGGYVALGHSWQNYSSFTGYTETWTFCMLGARAAYHFTIIKVKNLDVYAGAIAGFGFGPHTWYDNLYYGGGVKQNSFQILPLVDVFGGARYYLKNRMSVFVEVNAGTFTNVTGGLSFKVL